MRRADSPADVAMAALASDEAAEKQEDPEIKPFTPTQVLTEAYY